MSMTNIETFSDLQGINSALTVTVQVKPTTAIAKPLTQITVNNIVLFSGILESTVDLTAAVPLLQPFKISIELIDKEKPEDTIDLVSIKIDNFEIVPGYIHVARYDNKYSDPSKPTQMLGSEGIWILDISEPFYRWKHHTTHQGWLI